MNIYNRLSELLRHLSPSLSLAVFRKGAHHDTQLSRGMFVHTKLTEWLMKSLETLVMLIKVKHVVKQTRNHSFPLAVQNGSEKKHNVW